MRTKTLIFIAIAACTTLSFTFVSINSKKELKQNQTINLNDEPIGGYAIEDKL